MRFSQRRWWAGGMCAGLLLLAGCHCIHKPDCDVCAPCCDLPRGCRDHVHIFIINGLDPVNYANLTGLREYLIDLGFNNTSYGQLYHTAQFTREVRRIHANNPEARFVVIGFSFGANAARRLANQLNEENVPVDLLVYLGGNTLGNMPRDRPDNVRRIVNVLAQGAIWNGSTIDRAENLEVNDVYHFGSPAHPATVETLTRELAVVASQVPVVEVVEKRSGEDVKQSSLSKEWEFLRPTQELQRVPEEER